MKFAVRVRDSARGIVADVVRMPDRLVIVSTRSLVKANALRDALNAGGAS